MTKILKVLLFISLLILASCGDSNEETKSEGEKTEVTKSQNTQSKLRHYPGKDFSMGIPKTWNIITKDKDVVPNPRNGTIELAITSTQAKGGFSNNLIVLSQNLEKYTTSKNYSITNNIGAKNEYLNYYEIEGKNFIFADGEKSRLYVFKAKYATNTPLLKFIQTAYVCNNSKAFFLTLAIPTSVEDTKKYEEMLATFKCK